MDLSTIGRGRLKFGRGTPGVSFCLKYMEIFRRGTENFGISDGVDGKIGRGEFFICDWIGV